MFKDSENQEIAMAEYIIAIYRTALDEIAHSDTGDVHRIRAIARAALATKEKVS